ncbi:MAG: hypothetical protein ACPG7F_12570 [Aggregatilineales bacterium]
MPDVDARWLIDKRVIYACAANKGSIEFMEAHNQRMIALLNIADAPVYAILENRNFQPPVIGIRRTIEILSFIKHPALAHVIFINDGNPALDMTGQLIARFIGIRFKCLESVSEALDFLSKNASDLDMSQVNTAMLEQVSQC